ncbi:MAG: hypothetical protein Kow0098_26200 [Ignavibacteriaceae bacterium]
MDKITCLIIDDEREACDRLESLLLKIPGITVISKETDPDMGISKCTESSPDIVFLDVEMPGKSGFDIVNEIRNANEFPTFIFVTGYDQYAIKAIRNAAFDFLLKPVDIDELNEAVQRFIEQKKKLTEKHLPEKLKSKFHLTDREIEIIELLLQGNSSQQIAEKLFISKHTVDTHRRNILEKTGAQNTTELFKVIGLK